MNKAKKRQTKKETLVIKTNLTNTNSKVATDVFYKY